MTEIGFIELILILLVGLLVFGPETLPDALRSGYTGYLRLSARFQSMKDDFEDRLRSDEIVQAFKKDKEKLEELDNALRSTHLDFLDSFEKKT